MWDFKLKPETAAEIAEAETIEGKRKRLSQYAHYDALTCHVFDAAHYRGLSGDDTMTWLAYEALLELEQYKETAYNDLLYNVKPQVIFTGADAAGVAVLGARK